MSGSPEQNTKEQQDRMSSEENGKRVDPGDQNEDLQEREEEEGGDDGEGDGDEDAYESGISLPPSRLHATHKQTPSYSSSLPSLPKSATAAAAAVLQQQKQPHLHHQQSSPAATSSSPRPHSSGVTGLAADTASLSLSGNHRPAAGGKPVSPVPFGRYSSFSGSSSNSAGISSRNTDDSGFASGHFDTVSHGSMSRLMEGQHPISSISAAGTLSYQLENAGSGTSLSAYASGAAASEASGSVINPILAKEARTRSFLVGNLGCQVSCSCYAPPALCFISRVHIFMNYAG